MKTYNRDTLSRLGGTPRTTWVCLGVIPLRAGRSWALPALIAALNLLPAARAAAQTFITLHSFTATGDPYYTNSDGTQPYGLILSGSTLYGTAFSGGSSGAGTVFAVNTNGTGFTNLHIFTGPSGPDNTNSDGAGPVGNLLLSGDTLYGTAVYGGSSGNGTVFAVNTDGTCFTNLHSFTAQSVPYTGTNSDGAGPVGSLLLSGNTLYGTAESGGNSGAGTVFAVNTDGTGFTNLHSFTPSNPFGSGTNSDGALPSGGLILSGSTLYGTAFSGGSSGEGTVFALHIDGTCFTNLYSFSAASAYPDYINNDGANPAVGLLLSGSTLYGTASSGGSSGYGTVFALHTDGTGFTNLHSFTAGSGSYPNITNGDGAYPYAGLIVSGNTLYGTATTGGSLGEGTVFALHADGTGFTTLYTFTAGSGSYQNITNADGAYPHAGLIVSGNTLFGTATGGGNSGQGTVFSISFRPQLTITPSGVPPSGIILSWPTNVDGFDYTGFTLQSTTNLVLPVVWSTNSPAPVVVAGQNTVTNPITGAQKFFRLVH